MIDELERYVNELGLNARVERYLGAHHGLRSLAGSARTTKHRVNATMSACSLCLAGTSADEACTAAGRLRLSHFADGGGNGITT
jgi:hypothetical protein